MEAADPELAPLSFEEGITDIDAFYPSPEAEKTQPADAEHATFEAQDTEAAPADDPFANLMDDIEAIPDNALFGPVLDTSDLALVQNGVPPNPYSPVESSTINDKMGQSQMGISSRTALQAPPMLTPTNTRTASNMASSGDRIQLQAEMRTEEEDSTSPIENFTPLPKLALPIHLTPAQQASRKVQRSDKEIFSIGKSSQNIISAAQTLKRNRPSSSPSTSSQRQEKRGKPTAQVAPVLSRESSFQQSGTPDVIVKPASPTGVSRRWPTPLSREADIPAVSNSSPRTFPSPSVASASVGSVPIPDAGRVSRDSQPSNISTTGDEDASGSKEALAAPDVSKKRGKASTKKSRIEDNTGGSTKRRPRYSLGRRELKETIGNMFEHNITQSPRKTRIQRAAEQEARPNAGAAAKRRHTDGPKQQ